MDHTYMISLTVLLYELGIPYEDSPLVKEDRRFDLIELYSPGMGFVDGGLVVGNLSDILPIWKQHPQVCFLCLRNRFADTAEEEMDKKNVLILRSNLGIGAIYNRIIGIWQKLQRWNMGMMISVLTNQGLQSLLTLSEPIIGNHIDIMDATFKLLAYTQNIPIDDPVTNYLIEHGYHDKKTIQRLKELRRFEEFEKIDELILSTDYKMCNYETVKRVFHLNGNVHLYVVMHCNRKKVEPGLLELLKLMLTYVKKYTDRNTINPSTFAASQSFIKELLEKKISTVDEAINRAAYASIPFQKSYCLFAVSFQDNFNVPLETLVMLLSNHIVSSYVLSFNRRIVIVRHIGTGDKIENLKEKMETTLSRLLSDTPCIVGMSNVFDNLWQITTALEQAGCAIEYGSHVESGLSMEKRRPVALFDFEESFLTLIVAKSFNSSKKLFLNCFMVEAIKKLSDYDVKHGTNMLKTLEVYLNCGKKATEVCKRLHMHRNTVLYHIERIQSILDISMDDQDVCLKLQLGLMMHRTHMQELVDSNI